MPPIWSAARVFRVRPRPHWASAERELILCNCVRRMPAVATRFLRVDSITPHRTADYALQRIADNVGYPVRVIDAFVDALDLAGLGFDGVEPAATGRPAFHPSVLLKLRLSEPRAVESTARARSRAQSGASVATRVSAFRLKSSRKRRMAVGDITRCNTLRVRS